MFDYFGGVSEMVVPDNLLSAVTKAHRYDPDINANYQHLSEHYGFAIVPARVCEPKDKAKVENAVGIITRQILAAIRHITFTSIAEINAAIKPLLLKLNHQPFQKMKSSRFELFETIDKPALKALPHDRYYFEDWINAKIHIDYHFVFDYHFYCVPYKHIHHDVQIRATAKTVECFYQGIRIASHVRSYVRYGYTTIKECMPPSHRAHAEWGSERMKRWAKKIGAQTSEFIEVMMESRPFKEQAYRACLGLLRFAKRYGEDRLERACTIALNAGCTRYKQVESILEKQLDKIPNDEKTESMTPKHNNIRGKNYYH
jgi:transposase